MFTHNVEHPADAQTAVCKLRVDVERVAIDAIRERLRLRVGGVDGEATRTNCSRRRHRRVSARDSSSFNLRQQSRKKRNVVFYSGSLRATISIFGGGGGDDDDDDDDAAHVCARSQTKLFLCFGCLHFVRARNSHS